MFRTRDKLQRYEMVKFSLDDPIVLPGNNSSQNKTGYKFSIKNRSAFYDFYKGRFEVTLELQKKADGAGYAAADRITMINGAHSLIKHLVVKSEGKILYDSDNVHKVVNLKNLLEYSADYSKSVAAKGFWYLDTNGSTANTNTGFEARRILTQATNNDGSGGAKKINKSIPLNRYSFFEELQDKMLPPMSDMTFEITLNNDAELIHKAAAADDGRVVVTKFHLFLPRMIPKASAYKEFIEDFLKPTKWTYMKDLYNQSARTRAVQNEFRINTSLKNVKHVFIYFQRSNPPNNEESERTPYIFDTFKLNSADSNSSFATCRLTYGDNAFYPELGFNAESKNDIFEYLMNYAYRSDDFNTGTQLNPHNFESLYGLIYFDLTYQEEGVAEDPKQLILNYTLNTAPTADVKVHAIVFHESEVIVDKVGNQIMIV